MRKNKICITQQYQTFQLSPLQSKTDSYCKSVKLQFYTYLGKSKNTKLPSQQKWPKFNHDGLYYTPAFILPEDMNILSVSHDHMKNTHHKNMKAYQQPQTNTTIHQIAKPKEGRQHRCGVCKVNYQSFGEHIISETHKLNCSTSNYTRHIYNFIQQFFPSSQQRQKATTTGLKEQRQSNTRDQQSMTEQQQQSNFFQFEDIQQLYIQRMWESNDFGLTETPQVKRRKLL